MANRLILHFHSTQVAIFSLLLQFSCSSADLSGGSNQVARKKNITPPGETATKDSPPQKTDDTKSNDLGADLGGDPTTIPGIQAQKIGVSFEDGSDNDYNDVSICFDAPFKVDARPGLPPRVIMAAPKGQRVKVYLKSITGSIPTLTVRILDQNEKVIFEKVKVYTQPANSNTENPVGPFFEENFPFGSRLYVKFQWGTKSLNTDGTGKVQIEPNVCRNTGK